MRAGYIKSCFCLLNCLTCSFSSHFKYHYGKASIVFVGQLQFLFCTLSLFVFYTFKNLVTDVFPLVTCYRNLLSHLFQIFSSLPVCHLSCDFVKCVCVYIYVFNHKKFYIFMWSNLAIFSKCYGSWIWIMFNQGFPTTKLKYSSKFSFVAFVIFFKKIF